METDSSGFPQVWDRAVPPRADGFLDGADGPRLGHPPKELPRKGHALEARSFDNGRYEERAPTATRAGPGSRRVRADLEPAAAADLHDLPVRRGVLRLH